MRESFEKARDEAAPKFKFEHPHSNRPDPGFIHGADWAYEWLLSPENSYGAFSDTVRMYKERSEAKHKQLDQQAKIIEELKGALKEASKQFKCIIQYT